ncbi:exonuclease RecJ [Ekhidna lutea]|uniref:Single-stranded-DNA-specific exonuclease RecJ n=1 Tax=Ekhidna lutea TaxID=447679 RepID=A0A239EAU9_EKHLU|nr:single-stranded-DNA-specific exonuclease RecJ [Ekhidna lutea]SNS41591.1 exonuclease RecJ [Ekhidna lutea]
MEKQWVYREEPNPEIVEKLSKEININEYLAKILVQRGVSTFDQAKEFFRPSLSRLHDPFLMLNMDKAVNRLTEAVFNKEKILIYGDYDVDGTTSVSLVYLFLKHFSDNLEFYIPDRYTEGYGISKKGIDYAIEKGFKLIIALDCGVRAIDRAKQAQEAGIDLIICDHHIPGDELPGAYALLDPKQKDCKYPFKELSGCGVGFKLLEAFCQQNTIEKEKLFELLDLVAVSIASDIVPIVGENRILAFYGLKKLNHSPSAGLKSLIEVSGKKNEFSISDVVFSIGPRINAAGRLTHAKESVNLLIGDAKETDAFADNLNDRNKERREFDQSITSEALEMIAAFKDERKSTVLFKEDWHKGVIGIVASRCIEHYHRPTIILTESKGKATGSARSVDGFDVHQAISECSDLLEQFGGHTHAAGLTLPLKNVDSFINRFEEVVSARILPEQLIPKVEIDTEIPLSFITFKTLNVMNQMGPFGPKNMSPVFGTKNVIVDTAPKVIKDSHIKGFLHAQNSTKLFEFIGFGMANKIESIKVGKPFQIAYHLEENNYMGNKSLILNLKDVRFDA